MGRDVSLPVCIRVHVDLFCKRNQYFRLLCETCETVQKCPEGGEFPLSLCPGVGNRTPSEEKMANPRGCARGDGNSRN